jgi:hypothetical protein
VNLRVDDARPNVITAGNCLQVMQQHQLADLSTSGECEIHPC